MVWLFLSSLISAFSIPVNKNLFGSLNPFLISTVFCLSSAVFFLPFFRRQHLGIPDLCKIFLIGAVQFGLMYSLFQASFFFLQGHEVALLLITTPAYVAAIGNIFSKNLDRRRTAMAVVVGISVLFLTDFSQKFYFKWQGILLTQGCNFSFAIGQVLIKRFCERRNIENLFPLNAPLYAGAAVVCLPLVFLSGKHFPCSPASGHAIASAALFGIICCGICHWLWNTGAVKTQIHTLAAMNNLQIPMAVIISCTIFSEKIDPKRLFCSCIFLAAICLVSTGGKQRNST
ncbi:MAG: DMT family transporter [Puniceicoccales bacterium]|jgi:drug/metabolite transporter (DMT)-like permease|nr:DMT family transporter [Puniceicoccales bacterium]